MTADSSRNVSRAVAWRLGIGVLLVALAAVTIDRVAGPETPGSYGTLSAEITDDDRRRADAARSVRDAFDELLDAGDPTALPLGWLLESAEDGTTNAGALVDRAVLPADWSARIDDDLPMYAARCDGRIAVLVQSTVVSDSDDLAAWKSNRCPSPFDVERFVVFTVGEVPSS